MTDSSPDKLSPLQRAVLETFFRYETRFFLTGGAALAGFYLHHRSTLDLTKDGGCTPAALAWVLSEMTVPDDQKLPGGVTGAELRQFVSRLIVRLRRAAYPAS